MRAGWIVLMVVAALAAFAAVFVLGMRAKGSPVVAGMRRVNRAVFNPRQLKSAGQPGAFAAVVHHVGRNSGRSFTTPFGAVPCPEGFAVALVYGRRTDWLKNLQAAGCGEVVYEGQSVRVRNPEVRPIAEGASVFTPSDQRSHRLFGVQEFVVLHRV